MTDIHYATLDLDHFHFDAVGRSPGTVTRALERAWAKHARQTQATLTWDELSQKVKVRCMTMGAGYRDTLPLVQAHMLDCDQCDEAYRTIDGLLTHRTIEHELPVRSDDEIFGRFERGRS